MMGRIAVGLREQFWIQSVNARQRTKFGFRATTTWPGAAFFANQ